MTTAVLARAPDAGRFASSVFDGPVRDTALRPVQVFSTASVAAAQQFDAWQAHCGGFVGLLPEPGVRDGYQAQCTAWKLGPFALLSAAASAARYRRTREQIRRDAIDHWMIRVARHGTQHLRTPNGAAVLHPGQPCIVSLGIAMEGERSDLDWVSLAVPRDLFPGLAPNIDRNLNRPLGGSLGMLLGRYLEALEAQLGDMTEAELPRLVGATRAMVAACVAVPAPDQEAASPLADHARLERLRQAIRQNLRSPTLTPRRLCRMVGMSRSNLYRLFEPMGGVARYIQTERLREAHRALSNPDIRRDIHEVAEDLGFFDASAFSRTFRRAYGCTPSEVRAAALAGYGDSPLRHPAAPGPADSLTTLLRMLQ